LERKDVPYVTKQKKHEQEEIITYALEGMIAIAGRVGKS